MTKMAISMIGMTAMLSKIFAAAINGVSRKRMECADGDKEYTAALNEIAKFRGKVEDIDDEDNFGNEICVRSISFDNSKLTDGDVVELVDDFRTIYERKPMRKECAKKPMNYRLDLSFTSVKGKCVRELGRIRETQGAGPLAHARIRPRIWRGKLPS